MSIKIKFLTCLLLCSFLFSSSESTFIPKQGISTIKTPTSILQYLYAHNVVRARHRLPPLRWSTKLASFAKWYANQRRRDCALIHSNGSYGENIFWGQGSKWSPIDAVRAWASQESLYDYRANACLPGRDCYHYTQLVWRNSREVGCAKVRCISGDTFVVCVYNPHGNIIGQRPY